MARRVQPAYQWRLALLRHRFSIAWLSQFRSIGFPARLPVISVTVSSPRLTGVQKTYDMCLYLLAQARIDTVPQMRI